MLNFIHKKSQTAGLYDRYQDDLAFSM